MTDRELLEAAAKADGKIIIGWNSQHGGAEVAVLADGSFWQPLHENHLTDCMGDALRLAVRLFLFVIVEGDQEDDARRRTQAGHRSIGSKSQPHGGDPAAATRRAITRAAAAMKAPA